MDDWKDIHNTIQHDLGLCYIKSNRNSIKVIDVPSDLEVFSIALEIEKEVFLLVIVHRMPSSLGTFIYYIVWSMGGQWCTAF